MRVTATKCKARELKPGELFSTANQYYWDCRDFRAIGERVYIRTEAPATVANDPNVDVYRITIEPGVPQSGVPTEGGSITVARKEEDGTHNG